MKKLVGLVQKHTFSDEEIRRLEAGFREIYRENYSREKVAIFWMVIPEGYAFSERKRSNATIMLVEVDEDIAETKREDLMHLLSKFLLDNFDISPLDSVITVANSSFVNAFFNAQRKRINPIYRPWITTKMMASALISKITKGYFRLRVRY